MSPKVVQAPELKSVRTTGLLVLVFIQPIVRIMELRVDNVSLTPEGVALRRHPRSDTRAVRTAPARAHREPAESAERQPRQRVTLPEQPSRRHIHSNTLLDRLRQLGLSLLGARNRV
jgi:hypothetical protein